MVKVFRSYCTLQALSLLLNEEKKKTNLVHVTLSWQLKNRCVRIFHLTVSKQRMNTTGLVTLLLFSLSTHPTVGQ